MKTRTIFWAPPANDGGGLPPVHINCYDRRGNRIRSLAIKHNGMVKYIIPDVDENESLMDLLGADYTEKQPSGEALKRKPVLDKKEEPAPLTEPEDKPTRRLSKIEVMDLLAKNNIRFRTNERAETLWRKLPDDIKRNFILDKQES